MDERLALGKESGKREAKKWFTKEDARKSERVLGEILSFIDDHFEGRFRSSIVQADAYLLACQRYIELNPVRAGMVAAPADYPWSS